MGSSNLSKMIKPLLVASSIISSAFGTSFTDEHNDNSLSGWSVKGSRLWQESGTAATPAANSSSSGFLITNQQCAANGTLEVTITADTWNGQNGGVVFRWNSTSSFYFVALQPGNQYNNSLKFIKNSLNVSSSSAVTVASNFSVGNTFTLKIVMQGSTFNFYVNGTYRGQVTDATYASGLVGYGYAADYNDYVDYDKIVWTESNTVPAAPSNLALSVVSSREIDLSWKDNSSNESGYTIERATGDGSFSQIATVAANTTSYKNTGLSISTLYRYRIRAYNNSGNSTYSTTAQATTYSSNPSVSITSPSSNSTYKAPASITIAADAFDHDGSITVVQFYNGSTLLGSDYTAPYSYNWQNVPEGTCQLKAVAWDNLKLNTTSQPVTITVIKEPTRLLIIAGSEIYRMGNVASMLAEYQQDILNEGWTSEIITVNKVKSQYAEYSPLTEVGLKAKIAEYYAKGLEGILFVGSAKEIPTAYWRYHKRDYDRADPSDLFYADMDQWIDLDGDGVYETFDSKFDVKNDKWIEDISKPANPSNSDLHPDLIYGRISPDTTVEIREQMYQVCKYLEKIHNYRKNGSTLTDEQKNRSLYFINEEYAAGMKDSLNLQYATPDINVLAGYNLMFPEKIKQEINKGFMHAQFISHSGSDAHNTHSWKNEIQTYDGFSLEDVKSANAKIHQINLFNCSAARYTVPNFAATYIFNTDYTLTVTGSTGPWGTWMDSTFYTQLNDGLPVGKAFINWLWRADDGIPKGVLHGDPLITYKRSALSNKAPVFSTRLFSREAQAGMPFKLDIIANDPDHDPVTITLIDKPDDAQFNGTTLTWTPSPDLVGTHDTIIARVSDNHNNTTEQAFILYVSHFGNGMFENTDAWSVTGTGRIRNYPCKADEVPYGVPVLPLQTADTWVSASQSVKVKANTRYRFSFWSRNELTQNSASATVTIAELNQTIQVPVSKYFVQNFHNIYTGNNTNLTISFNSGNAASLTKDTVFFTLLRLVEESPFNGGFNNGDFEIGSDNCPALWYFSQKYRDQSSELTWETAGSGRSGRCISITNTEENDSRLYQLVNNLVPGARYLVRGYIKGQNISDGNDGANICIVDGSNECSKPTLTGTFDWTPVEFTFTAPSNGTVNVGCRLGYFGSTVSGKAWFDDITVTPVN